MGPSGSSVLEWLNHSQSCVWCLFTNILQRQKKNDWIICTKKWKKDHFPKNSHLTRTENDGLIKDTVCACKPRRFYLVLQPFRARSGINGLNLVCLSGCGNVSIEPKELDLHWANLFRHHQGLILLLVLENQVHVLIASFSLGLEAKIF